MRSSAGLVFLRLAISASLPWVDLVPGCSAANCWRPAYPALIIFLPSFVCPVESQVDRGTRQGNEKPTARRLQGDEQAPVAGRCRPISGSHPSRIRTESGPFAYQTRPGAQSRTRLRPAESDRNLTAPPCAQSSQPASVRSPPERHVHPARPGHRMPPVLDRQHPVKPQPGSSAPDDDVAVSRGMRRGRSFRFAAEQKHCRQTEGNRDDRRGESCSSRS